MALARKTALIRDDYLELIKRFPLAPIRDDGQLREAYKVIEELSIVDEDRLSDGQADYLEVLSDLTIKYEQTQHPMELSQMDSIDVLKYLLEENHLSASDLGRLLGNRELGSKVLRRERSLSKAHILILSKRFKVQPSLFF